MKRWLFITSLLLLSLTGCATTPSEQLRKLDSRDSCCKKYADVAIQKELIESIDASIDESSPIIATEMGASYFYAIKLPEQAGGKILAIKSRGGAVVAVSMTVGAHMYFLPSVMFLDLDKNKISTVSDNNPIGLCEGFSCSGGLLSRFKIPGNARYALIHANRRRAGEVYYAPMSKTPPGMTVVVGVVPVEVGRSNSAMHVVFSPTGNIQVSVQ